MNQERYINRWFATGIFIISVFILITYFAFQEINKLEWADPQLCNEQLFIIDTNDFVVTYHSLDSSVWGINNDTIGYWTGDTAYLYPASHKKLVDDDIIDDFTYDGSHNLTDGYGLPTYGVRLSDTLFRLLAKYDTLKVWAVINVSETVLPGDFCVANKKGMMKVDADRELRSIGLMGIAMDSIPSGSRGRFLLHGRYVQDSAFVKDLVYFLSHETGKIDSIMPYKSNSIVRIVGVALHQDTLFFRPVNSYIEWH